MGRKKFDESFATNFGPLIKTNSYATTTTIREKKTYARIYSTSYGKQTSKHTFFLTNIFYNNKSKGNLLFDAFSKKKKKTLNPTHKNGYKNIYTSLFCWPDL